MSRTTSGWLTADSLKSGEREQYAVQRSYGKVIVELRYDPINVSDVLEMPWVTTITIDPGSVVTKHKAEAAEYRSFRLSAARQKFNQLVRKHP